MEHRCLPLVLLILLVPAKPGAQGRAAEEAEALSAGQSRERAIGAGETHRYRIETSDAPLLVVVEQRGIDLVVKTRGATDQDAVATDSLNGRWGPEVLVLPPGAAGTTRIEVGAATSTAPPGSYAIRLEALPPAGEESPRTAALAAMSRAGRLGTATPEARQQAMAAYGEALAIWRSLGERRWEAETLQVLAVLERQSGELRAALEHQAGAAALWSGLAEMRREAAVLRGLGTTRVQAGEIAAARQALQRSRALWEGLGQRFEEGMASIELCLLEQTSGALAEALACYQQTRVLFREIGDGSQEARMLNNLGGLYDLLGEPDAALDHYERALALRRALGDRRGEAETLNNLAVVHRVLGEWQEALRIYDQVREILVPLGDRWLEARRHGNVGFTYLALGEPQRALASLEKALGLYRQMGARRDELIAQNNLGAAARQLGDVERSLACHRLALELAAALADPRQEAVTRLHLAEIHLDRGDAAAALREIDPAQAYLQEKGLRQGESNALQLRARALVLAGRPRDALPVLQEVLARRRDLRDRAGQAETLRSLAAVERSLGLVQESRAHAEAALAQVEELRSGFVSPDLRTSFLATRRRVYSLLIDLHMDRHAADPGGGHDRAALAISEQARARSLLDALYAGGAGRAGDAVPAELAERRRSLRRRLSAKADQQLKQTANAEALGQEIDGLLTELHGVEAQIRRHDPRYAAVSRQQPVGAEGVAALLDSETLLLEYSLGEERSYLWAVRSTGLRSFVLPPQGKIEELSRRVHEELSTIEPGAERRTEAAAELSRILLGPVWSETARLRRLVLVPDGALHVLPFGALPVPDPGRKWDAEGLRNPLLERFEVAYLPSATTLARQRQRSAARSQPPKWAAVLADPVFAAADPRLAGADPVRGGEADGTLRLFERLPATQQEARKIAELAPPGQVWIARDFAANREAVLSPEIRSYRVIHFATHAVADTENPELTGLVLSLVDAAGRPREGFLGLSDVYELDLAADLVVLSGCRTALGREVRGEGVMGLTRGFLYAGVPQVIASLWRVQDRTTAELMARFYREMWQSGLSSAAALREAQRSLRREPRYRDPYFWAGFVLQGDWRAAGR